MSKLRPMSTPDEPLTFDQFLDRLDIGEYDERLGEIEERVALRQVELLNRQTRSLKPGDTLRFNDDAAPKYLRGKTCTYVGTNEEKNRRHKKPWVRVKMPIDPSYKNYSGRQSVNAPLAILDPVKGTNDPQT